MTPVAHIVATMEAASASLRKWDADAMKAAARDVEDAAAMFDPRADLVGGLRRLNGAVARAARLYGQKTGRSLIPDGPTSAPADTGDDAA